MDSNECNDELQCRICAEFIKNKDRRIHIFEEDAKRNYLQAKIRKYLYILVSSEDRLPKIICFTCVKKLDEIHRFATMAHRAQERLKNHLYSEDDDSGEEIEDEAKNNRGLLRSMLVGKDDDEKERLSPSSLFHLPIRSDDEAPSTTEEMEVKIDPMIFLQCGLDRPISPEMSETYSDTEDKSSQTKCLSALLDEERRKFHGRSPTKSIDNHHQDSTFDCTICSSTFESQINLQKHLWSHLSGHRHDDDDRKPIQVTNEIILHNNGNVDSDDINNTIFICPICNKRISTKGNLKVHLETHRPKGKYGCDICGRIFKTQSNLFRHKEYHGGIQFPCSVCGRVYPTNSTLRAHSITHSDLRPHACPLCDKTFKRNQDLKFHINQHTGARPYQCPYCPKAFASSGNCFSHRKRMHPKEVHRDRQRAADLMR